MKKLAAARNIVLVIRCCQLEESHLLLLLLLCLFHSIKKNSSTEFLKMGVNQLVECHGCFGEAAFLILNLLAASM